MRNNGKAKESLVVGLIRVGAVAQLLNVCKRTVWRYDKEGKIPAPKRVGGAKWWDRNDLELWWELGRPNRKKFESLKQKRKE